MSFDVTHLKDDNNNDIFNKFCLSGSHNPMKRYLNSKFSDDIPNCIDIILTLSEIENWYKLLFYTNDADDYDVWYFRQLVDYIKQKQLKWFIIQVWY